MTIKKLRIDFENGTNDNTAIVQMLQTLVEEIQDGQYDLDPPGEDWSPIEQYEKGSGEIWFSTESDDEAGTDEAGDTGEYDE